MNNRDILDMLYSTGAIKFSMNDINKSIIESFIDRDDAWNLNETLKYAKLINKNYVNYESINYIEWFIKRELLNGNPILTKSIYNTFKVYNSKDLRGYDMVELYSNVLKNKLRSLSVETITYLRFFWYSILELKKINIKDSACQQLGIIFDKKEIYLFKKKLYKYDMKSKRLIDMKVRLSKLDSFDSYKYNSVLNIQNFDILI